MTQNEKQKILLPDLLTELLVEDIIESSDEEILEEARAKYGDIDVEAARIRQIISIATVKAKKAKLALARKEMQAARNIQSADTVLSYSLDAKKALIKKASSSVASLTLAARNGEEMTENDANCALQDLIDLGVIDKDGNLQ